MIRLLEPTDGTIEFDGDEVEWSKVTEIRARRLVGYLLTDAVTKGVDRLPLWWFPGRGLVLRHCCLRHQQDRRHHGCAGR